VKTIRKKISEPPRAQGGACGARSGQCLVNQKDEASPDLDLYKITLNEEDMKYFRIWMKKIGHLLSIGKG
jgi:hypothetical protein